MLLMKQSSGNWQQQQLPLSTFIADEVFSYFTGSYIWLCKFKKK